VTAVFVHGVPETSVIWDALRARLPVESVALALPGFGTPRPEGFGATKDEYVDWILAELDRIDGPIDLVGHDWGGIMTTRIASAYGDRLHSWAADCVSHLDPGYVWRTLAKEWQTPGDGEAYMASGRLLDLADRFSAKAVDTGGVPENVAAIRAAVQEPAMQQSILDLYRSATPNPHTDWGNEVAPSQAPGLAIGGDPMTAAVAERLGARVEALEGLGHCWMWESPERSAELLQRFWGSLP
jgi:pimeloyl-ACP methyl ester carboxylesterase